MLKTVLSSFGIFQNRNIFVLCCLPRVTRLMSVPRKCCGIQIGQLTRFVHYEPNVDLDLDRKQKEVLKNFEITEEDCNSHPKIWHTHPQTIEHHGLVLQEGGFSKLSASLIVNYYTIVRKKIKLLKLHNYINPDTEVSHSFLTHLGNPPLENIVLKNDDENENKFIEVYEKVLKSFLIWRLQSSEEEINKIIKVYPRIKHKSLKYMFWSLDILEHKLNFSKEKILRHGYLIHSYPNNILNTLDKVPTLCGEDIKSVLLKFPKILMSTTRNLLNTIQHFKDFNIPDDSVRRCFEIFTLGSDSVKKRLQLMHTMPEFRPYLSNPRALFIVHYQRKVSARLDQLQELQRQCASLHVLTSKQSYFDKFAREGIDRSRGNDTVNFLTERLGIQESTIRSYLGRHPFWCSVPCITIQKTLDFLLEEDYSKEDIINNIHIILYNRERVEEILTGLPTNKVVKNAQDLIKARNHSPRKEITLTKSHQLALCLYFLEKDHHFTGNGVWNSS